MNSSHAHSPRRARRLALAIATALTCASTGITAAPGIDGQSFVLSQGSTLDRGPGRVLVHDYGRQQLWRLTDGSSAEFKSASGESPLVLDRGVQFEAGEFDPLNRRQALAPAGFENVKGSDLTIELVQFAGPIDKAWRADLDRLGVKVLQYIPDFAYAVLADATGRARLGQYAQHNGVVRMTAGLEPVYKLNRELFNRATSGLRDGVDTDVTVVLARHAGNASSKQAIQALARGALKSAWWNFGEFEAITLPVNEADIATLARLPDVFAVEHHVEPELLDEVQNQIIAGNFNANRSGPSGPGYQAWLVARGFSTNPADYPVVAVVDDGVGNGTNTAGAGDPTLTQNRDGSTSRVTFAFNCSSDANALGRAGHGHINASIIAGFDDRTALPFTDPNGYLRGQGVNPFGRVGNTKFFNNAGSASTANCGGSQESMIRNQQLNDARISSNSWGAPVSGDYNANSATYDAATRDANTLLAGLQPMIFLIAAGNSGSGASTIGSPATAKNVITVGASENQRPTDEAGNWTDGCSVAPTGADNAMDVIGFSSRGPAEGGRVKPEVIAPGTHIQGTASTGTGYDGTGVCDQYRPPGQTTFASSSGTSHSTPALAGVASLMYRYLQTEYSVASPSAALVKGYMMAHPTYLTGVSGNGNLPTNVQGYGMPNLGLAFDDTTSRIIRDQLAEDAFDNSGQEREFLLAVDNPAKPVRVALVYSDAPGAVTGNPQVNNLDLVVENSGNTYLGNRFTGEFSVTGGSADTANNYEAVFLPSSTSGLLTVKVRAFNIAGDGIPGNADTTDQDFALVCSNCTEANGFGLQVTPAQATSCGNSGASTAVNVLSFSGFTDPVALSIPTPPAGLTSGFAPASGNAPFSSTLTLGTAALADGTYPIGIQGVSGDITRTGQFTLGHSSVLSAVPALNSPANGATDIATAPSLTWTAVTGALDYVVEVATDAAFTNIVRTATVTTNSYTPNPALSGATQYHWRVRSRNNCGASANSTARSFTTVPVFCVTPNLSIPDNNPTGVTSSMEVAFNGVISDLDVPVKATHTWIGDLIITLTKTGSGTTVRLIDRPGRADGGTTGNGCSGDNPDIILDDEAATAAESSCTNTIPGYVAGSRHRPNDPLSAFDGISLAGTWVVTVSDNAGADLGTLDRWCLEPTFSGANVPPVIANQSFRVYTTFANGTAIGTIAASDPGDTLTYAVTGGTGQALFSVNASTGQITLTNAAGLVENTNLTLNVTVTDSQMASASATITLRVVGNMIFTHGFEGS